MLRRGSCHCGAVTFEVDTPDPVVAQDCNCSLCAKVGYLHVIVPQSRFRIITGADDLTTYTFNTGVAKHTFCKICGVKAFYIPRSNPDGVDVNARCLSPVPESIRVEPFDGQNWEKNAAALAHLSQEPPRQ